MDPEWKARWVEALRSGNFKQGFRALRRRNGSTDKDAPMAYHYCCLGVICELHPDLEFTDSYDINEVKTIPYPAAARSDMVVSRDGLGTYIIDEEDTNEFRWVGNSFIPEPVAKKLGITSDVQRRLAELNDGMVDEDGGFDVIADWIEAYL